MAFLAQDAVHALITDVILMATALGGYHYTTTEVFDVDLVKPMR